MVDRGMTFHLSFSSSKSLSGKPSFTISTKAFLRLLNCPPSGEATKRCRPHDLLLQPTGGDFRCCNTSLPPILRHCFNQPVHPADVLLRVILVVKGTQLWMARMKAIATRVVWPPLSCSMSLRGSASTANVTRGVKFSGRLQLLLF